MWAGLRQLPHELKKSRCRRVEWQAISGGKFPAVSGELRMLLPSHGTIRQLDTVMLGLRIRATVATRFAERGKCLAIILRQLRIHHEGKMQHAPRWNDAGERSGMHLAKNRAAQGMRFEIHEHQSISHLQIRQQFCPPA